MDEEFLKRNTDCVYFLASPLTCKKGIECEFRHNEIARLNPRDCWYWLSGSCLNPTCAFRHPPLDAGVPSEPTQSSLPANKTMVPCYFFFNGVCNKGERCSFLHGPDDSVPTTVKPVKNAFGSTDTLIPESKTSSGNKTVVASVPTQTSYETVAKAPLKFDFQSKEDLKQSVPNNVKQRSASPQIPTFEYKEAATVTGLDSLLPAEGFVHNISHSSAEQSSGEQVSNRMEPEERLESSPGFDVLVDVDPENLDYEDDAEYLPVLDGEGRELNGQYLGYEYKDPDEYDPMCTESQILYEDERYDDCRFLDGEHTHANERKLPSYSRDIFLNSILSRTRVHMPAEMAVCGRNMDLRDHLRRRRENNCQLVSGFLRRHESPRLVVQNQERHRRRSIEQQRSRRLASEVGLSTITCIREGENLSIPDKHFVRNSQQHNRSRKHYREKLAKRQFRSSDVLRKQVPKERRSTHESTTFTGPKTLAQIKEEKKKYEENVCFRSSSGDFQDPKPLSEILKDKRRSDCARDGNNCNN